ncbi:protein BCAP [Drosophila nasuta]|uniref:protein BCAP n=1 Tax=Drosophila nasuta TaxID=42062 RepID=UPI00295E4DF6|nr:protein BCAP [Drosophila nasuta]
MDGNQMGAEEPNAGDNMQLDFLQYFNSLSGMPQVVENNNNDTGAVTAEQLLMDTDINMPLTHEQLMESLMASSSPKFSKDPEPAIPQITISVPEGQFLNGELDPQLSTAEITISFNDLPTMATTAAPEPMESLDISACSVAELQQVRQALLKHNFVHKLHLAASSPLVTFLNWSASGEQLQVDYIGLQEHLSGTQSMFRCLNVQHFIQQLLDIGFKRVQQHLQHAEARPTLYYLHENFNAGQPDQMLLLSAPKWELDSTDVTYSALQLARARFQTLLLYHNDVRLLHQQEPSADQLLPRRGRICNSRQPAQLLTQELAHKLVNPRETVLQAEAAPAPEYAGYYGTTDPALIAEFFAEYLPRFGPRNSGYKDIVVDASKANSFQQNLPIGIVYSEDEEELESQKSEETSPPPIVEVKTEEEPVAEVETSLPEDFELEQVMQELCGVVSEVDDNGADKEKGKEKELEQKEKEEKMEELSKKFKQELDQELTKMDPKVIIVNPKELKQESVKEDVKQLSKEPIKEKAKELDNKPKDMNKKPIKREVKKVEKELNKVKPKELNKEPLNGDVKQLDKKLIKIEAKDPNQKPMNMEIKNVDKKLTIVKPQVLNKVPVKDIKVIEKKLIIVKPKELNKEPTYEKSKELDNKFIIVKPMEPNKDGIIEVKEPGQKLIIGNPTELSNETNIEVKEENEEPINEKAKELENRMILVEPKELNKELIEDVKKLDKNLIQEKPKELKEEPITEEVKLLNKNLVIKEVEKLNKELNKEELLENYLKKEELINKMSKERAIEELQNKGMAKEEKMHNRSREQAREEMNKTTKVETKIVIPMNNEQIKEGVTKDLKRKYAAMKPTTERENEIATSPFSQRGEREV